MRKEKQLHLSEIQKPIASHSFLVVKYKMGANLANSFRRELGKGGSHLEVTRKRMLLKAAKDSGVDLKYNSLDGHIGVVFVESNPLDVTKMVFKFREDNADAIEVVGGRIDGQLYNGTDMEKLSKLPSMDEMRAQLLSVFEAPLSQTLATMEAILASVVYCLDNKCKAENATQESN